MKKEIKIDYTDWFEDVSRKEMIVSNEDDFFDLVDRGKRTSDIAIAAIVSREEGLMKDEIIKSNKALLLSGGMLDVSKRIKRKKEVVETPLGNKYRVPVYIGEGGWRDKQNGDEDEIENYIKSEAELGSKMAERYILKVVPQHIWSNLLLVYKNEGDVEGVLEQLKKKIDEMKLKLMG